MAVIGFTGTKYGTTAVQLAGVTDLLWRSWTPGSWFVHGDCIGADAEAAIQAKHIGYKIWIWPGDIERYRAFGYFDRCEEPGRPLARDRKIVDSSDWMIAAPKTNYEVRQSGTWSTVRYAKKLDKRVEFVYPH